jgi:hypothetical protein
LERIASDAFKETAMSKTIIFPAKVASALMVFGVSGMVRYSIRADVSTACQPMRPHDDPHPPGALIIPMCADAG